MSIHRYILRSKLRSMKANQRVHTQFRRIGTKKQTFIFILKEKRNSTYLPTPESKDSQPELQTSLTS